MPAAERYFNIAVEQQEKNQPICLHQNGYATGNIVTVLYEQQKTRLGPCCRGCHRISSKMLAV